MANGWQQLLWRTKGPPLRGGEEKTRGGTETDIEKISLRVDFVFFVQPVDFVLQLVHVLVQLHQHDANQQNSGDEVALVRRVCLICLQNLSAILCNVTFDCLPPLLK